MSRVVWKFVEIVLAKVVFQAYFRVPRMLIFRFVDGIGIQQSSKAGLRSHGQLPHQNGPTWSLYFIFILFWQANSSNRRLDRMLGATFAGSLAFVVQ